MSHENETVFMNMEMEPTELKEGQNTENAELDQLFLELGKAYYEGGFEDPLPQLLPLFDRITQLKKPEKAARSGGFPLELSPEKGAPKDLLVCPECGAELPDKARFCGVCGTPAGNAMR